MCGAKRRGHPELTCRGAPIAGGTGRCRHHGGLSSGRGQPLIPRSERQHHSKAVAIVKKASRALVEKIELHPDTERNFAPYIGTLYKPSEAQALLACDQWTRGEISKADFEKVLDMARQHMEPRNPNPKRWKRKASIVATSMSKSTLAATTSRSKSIEPELVIESRSLDRRYAARPASARESIETIESWRSPQDRNRKGW